jgi:hypothetical protein
MKVMYLILGLAAGAALLLASGCSKQEQPAGDVTKAMSSAASEPQKPLETQKPAAEPAQPAAAASQPASAATSEAQKAVESPKAAAEQAQPAVAAAIGEALKTAASQTNAVAAAASSQVQGLIDKAKGLVTDQKYQDALNVIQQLSSLQLTPEQQKLVDGLKAQIQTALAKATATDAASALGNVLGGKK